MPTLLSFGRDIQGYNAFAAPVSSDKFSATLASAGNSTITLPPTSQNWIVSFSYQPGSDIWVSYNGTAAAPVGSTFASSNSELLPGSRKLPAFQNNGTTPTTINFYNNGSGIADVGVILYAVS